MAKIRQVWVTLAADLWGKRIPGSAEAKVQRNVRINIYHGVIAQTALNMAAPFIGIFAVKSGASDFQVGLLSSGPALVSLLSMVPGGKLVDRHPAKKKILIRLILLQRLFYLFISTIPFFTADRRAWLLVLAVAFMNIPASIANVGWQAFISTVIPASLRADAFAARNRLMNVVGTIAVLATGRAIDILGFPLGYQVAFAAAFVLTLVEIWVFGKIEEGAVSGEKARMSDPQGARDGGSRSTVFADMRELLRHERFVRYMLGSMLFYLCWQIPWPLFTLYQVKVLGANNLWVSLLNLANTGGSLVGYGFWARQINRHGNLKTLFMSTLGIFIVPLAYAFSRNLATVATFNLLTGAIFSGVNLALFNALLEVTPEERKATYIAYYTTAVNGSAILAPMFGVGLLNLLGFFWAFIVSAVLRLSGSLVFLGIYLIEKRTTAKAG